MPPIFKVRLYHFCVSADRQTEESTHRHRIKTTEIFPQPYSWICNGIGRRKQAEGSVRL